MNIETEKVEISQKDWGDILYDINTEKAVLLIGPEFMAFNGKPVHSYLRDQLLQSNRDDITYYYERDGLFLFAPEGGRSRVIRDMQRLYDSITPDEAILSRIAQIPFPLIISLNPDHFLSQTFYQKGKAHQFQFNRANEKKEVEMPTSNFPLIYNLFGSIYKNDSLVLDYNDVYKTLKWIFDNSNLPSKFLTCYHEAQTCIFLGFQFDRWYSQLTLKILNGDEEKEKHIAIKMTNNIDAEAFIMKQFKIKFIGNQFNLIDEIYNRYANKYGLPDIDHTPTSAGQTETIKQVLKGDYMRAINLILIRSQSIEQNKEDEIIHLQARFNKLDRDRPQLDTRDYQSELNKIIGAIIAYAKELF